MSATDNLDRRFKSRPVSSPSSFPHHPIHATRHSSMSTPRTAMTRCHIPTTFLQIKLATKSSMASQDLRPLPRWRHGYHRHSMPFLLRIIAWARVGTGTPTTSGWTKMNGTRTRMTARTAVRRRSTQDPGQSSSFAQEECQTKTLNCPHFRAKRNLNRFRRRAPRRRRRTRRRPRRSNHHRAKRQYLPSARRSPWLERHRSRILNSLARASSRQHWR